MSLEKIKVWLARDGRLDITQGRSPRELLALDRFTRIALDLIDVVPHQGAKVGKGGEHADLAFGRNVKGRKTPIIFCGILFRNTVGQWTRRNDMTVPDSFRIYLRISPAGAHRSPWKDMIHDDDTLKPDPEWRYVEIPPTQDLGGEELLNLVEDAYFEVVGI